MSPRRTTSRIVVLTASSLARSKRARSRPSRPIARTTRMPDTFSLAVSVSAASAACESVERR